MCTTPNLWIQKTLKRNFGEKTLVSINPLNMGDHIDAWRKFRNCPPRLSEPPTPDGSPTLSETPIEDPEEQLERFKLEAKQAYDTLIQIGGRPTRPIRLTPPWTKVLVGGEIWYRYAEQYEELFYDGWYGYEPGPNNSLTEADFIRGHWRHERGRCNEELRRWQDFLDTQQWRRDHRPEFAREEDMERQRYMQDPDLTASLKKLKDWKEYQVYFQKGIDRLKRGMERDRRAVEAIQRNDPEVDWSTGLGKFRGLNYEGWLDSIERRREKLAPEKKRLEWVKKQRSAVLSKCAASLMESPTCRHRMEERSELEAKQVYNTLMNTGGRPRRPIQPISNIYDVEHTDKHLHVLCHWEGECSQFEEELRKWEKFLDYRQKKKTDRETKVQLKERQSAEGPTQVDFWKEYRFYQQMEVENAKQWVEFWQRQVKYFQQKEDNCVRQGLKNYAYRHRSHGEETRSYLEEVRKQVKPTEMQLQWVEQQLSALLAECAVSSAEVSTSDHLEAQAITPKRSSRSGQLKGLGSDRSGRSTLRSNQKSDKNKRRASGNSALGPIHSSKVSKAAGRKAPCPRKQSTVPADHDNGQNQGPRTTISSSLPANVAPRRSSRLEINRKKSDALKAGLAADLGRSVQPLTTNIIMRRSDRVSQQKERQSTSTSSTAVNSAMALQTDPLRRLSRSKPKDRHADNKSDPSPTKPRGISKRQESKFSRNRTKFHN